MIYQPKGGMCAACIHAARDCTHLDFAQMPVIGKWRGVALIVKCREFQKRGGGDE